MKLLMALFAALALALSACGGDTHPEAVTETVIVPPTTSEEQAAFPEEVTQVLDALDDLAADFSEPVEHDPGISGSETIYKLDIVGYSSGINIFASTDDLETWQEASDFFGGVSVTFEATAVTLNSGEGKNASLSLAPQLAEKLGGIAHTGGEAPDNAPSGNSEAASEEPRSIWAPPGQGHQCPGTDARVWDFAECNPSNEVIDPEEFYRIIEQNRQPDHDGVPFADGGNCPAYLCGYGHDEHGNPNPTSGELQSQAGCEQGYIIDPELCAAVGRPIG